MFLQLFMAFALATAPLGCGEDASGTGNTGSSTDTTATASDAGVSAGGDAEGQDTASADVPPPEVTESFWVSYIRHPALGSDPDEVILTGWQNPGAVSNASKFGIGVDPRDPTKPGVQLSKAGFATAAKGLDKIGCKYGCILSQNLRLALVAIGPATKDGYSFQLGEFDEKLQFNIKKYGQLDKVQHVEFAGKYVFYSTAAKCNATGKCQYDIRRWGPIDIDPAGWTDEAITRMAPDDDPDVTNNDTTYNGYFRASANGKTLTFLTTTIRSVKQYVWHETEEGGKVTANISKLDYICQHPEGDGCVGTGSQYHDDDPVAISDDGKTIVFFSIVDRWLRVRKYVLETEQPSVFSDLIEVTDGAYLQGYCKVLKPWQYGQVRGQPAFSADGKTVYFLGYSDCPYGGTQKKWTGLVAFDIARIGSTFKAQDWRDLTKNPKDNSALNRVIQQFVLSPKKQAAILVTTRWLNSSGKPSSDTDMATKQDSELSWLNLGGGELNLITNEVSQRALQPMVHVPAN
jgi:hypothetical protein